METGSIPDGKSFGIILSWKARRLLDRLRLLFLRVSYGGVKNLDWVKSAYVTNRSRG